MNFKRLFGCKSDRNETNRTKSWQETFTSGFSDWQHVPSRVKDLLLSFETRDDFEDFRDTMFKTSPVYFHLCLNERTLWGREFLKYIEVLADIIDGSITDLPSAAKKYPAVFENYLADQKRKELLECGVDEFTNHIKLLKKKDPELARQKVLKLVSEVL